LAWSGSDSDLRIDGGGESETVTGCCEDDNDNGEDDDKQEEEGASETEGALKVKGVRASARATRAKRATKLRVAERWGMERQHAIGEGEHQLVLLPIIAEEVGPIPRP
jgi:hypothetical protein